MSRRNAGTFLFLRALGCATLAIQAFFLVFCTLSALLLLAGLPALLLLRIRLACLALAMLSRLVAVISGLSALLTHLSAILFHIVCHEVFLLGAKAHLTT